MSKPSRTRIATTQEIFHAAIDSGMAASLARTLAECLYWSQHSSHKIDGKTAFYKTGPDLSKVLGLSARTINAHLKRLRDEGFWQIKYRSRPTHPSPVTWLIIADRAEALLSEAGESRKRGGSSRALEGVRQEPSEDRDCDIRRLRYGTTYRNTSNQEDRERGSFASERELRRKELNSSGEERIKAPKYLRASKELEEFVRLIASLLAKKSLPPWDMASRYTWSHADELFYKLHNTGIADLKAHIALLEEIFDRWPDIRLSMDVRYRDHKVNALRPSPMALNDQFHILIEALEDKSEPIVGSLEAGHSNLDGGFG